MNFLLETTNTTELFGNVFKPDMVTSYAYDSKQPLYMNTLNSHGNYGENLCNPKTDSLQRFGAATDEDEDQNSKPSRKTTASEKLKQSKGSQSKTERKRVKSTTQSKSKVTDTQTLTANGSSACHNDLTSADSQPKQPKKRGPKKKPLTKEREVRLKNRRVRANARERTRMHSLNHALELLRNHVPTFSTTQRLSKIETLRLAKNYIRTLSELLTKETPPSPLEMALTLTEGLSQNTSNLIASTLQVSPRALIQLQRQMNPHRFDEYTSEPVNSSTDYSTNHFTPEWCNEPPMYAHNNHLNPSVVGQNNSVPSPLMISPLSSVTPPLTSQTPPSYPISVMPNYAKPPSVEDSRLYSSAWIHSYSHGFSTEADLGPTDYATASFQEHPISNLRHQQLPQQSQQLGQHQSEHHPYHSPMMLDNFQSLCPIQLTNSRQ